MKHIILSHLRYHAERFEKDTVSEREFLQTILDLCIERIVDLDQGRDDDCVTGSYDRSQFANVLVEAEVLNCSAGASLTSQPPVAHGSLPHFPSSLIPTALPSEPGIEIQLDSEDLDETEIPVCPRISCTPAPFKGPVVPV
jgi:hypothetical protein